MSTSTTPDRPAPPQVIFDSGSHAALYADGLLVTTGSTVDVLRKALDLAGVEVSTSDDFLLGRTAKTARDYKAMAAPTLEAIEAFVSVREKVADLRTRAAALEAEAAELEAALAQGRPVPADDTDPLGLGDAPDTDETDRSAETSEEQQ